VIRIEPSKPFKKPSKPDEEDDFISKEIKKLKSALSEEELEEEREGEPDVDNMVQTAIQLHFLKQLIEDLNSLLHHSSIKEELRDLIQDNVNRIKEELDSGQMDMNGIEEATLYLHKTMQKIGKIIMDSRTEANQHKEIIQKYEGEVPFTFEGEGDEKPKKQKVVNAPFLLQKKEVSEEEDKEEEKMENIEKVESEEKEVKEESDEKDDPVKPPLRIRRI
jgi:hypothetical protein